jgi:hypothetical protein
MAKVGSLFLLGRWLTEGVNQASVTEPGLFPILKLILGYFPPINSPSFSIQIAA